jgi:iron complex outermembrane receptor protein
MKSLSLTFMLGSAAAALLLSFQHAAEAQPAPSGPAADVNEATEQVVVTGTSIRGVAPAGTNMISLSPVDIENSGATTVQALLANTPVVSGFGNAGEGSRIHNNYYQPSIHNLGASGSNATLILVDGHQFPTGGTNHTTADPNIIPSNMLQSVDIIANGDSSIYGSNAVAGVINFITRSRYDGLQLNAQADYMEGATNFTGGVLSGASWNRGNVVFGYQYVEQGALTAAQRSFSANPDQTARAISAGLPVGQAGGSSTNFDTFAGAGPGCSQPLVRLNGAGNYYNLVTGAQIGTAQANATCNLANENTLVEHEVRNNVMIRLRQDITQNLSAGVDLLYAQRQDHGVSGAGSVSNVTVFATGPQANPFFQLPPGYTGPAVTRETVYANLDSILGGRGTYNTDGASTMYAAFNAEYHLPGDFVIDGLAVAGRDDSYQRSNGGAANSSSVYLALNGTGNSGGNTTAPAIANTTIVPLNLPLTTANALDIWNTGSANRTSQAVKDSITDSKNLQENIAGFAQFRLSTNGTVLQLPAGPLKIAAGIESVRYTLQQQGVSSNGTGRTTTGANFQLYNFNRIVRSAFVEAQVPLIGPDAGLPLVQKFEVNLSGRYDGYSDVGDTKNYKIAFGWDVVDGLKLRGNMSSSFVAPGLDQLGDKNHAFIGTNVGATTAMDGIPIPVAAYPALTQFAPSQFNNGQPCTLASVTCVLASTVQGVNIHGGAANAHPAIGRGWEVGADFAPAFLPGLSGQVTFWHSDYLGAFTTPSVANVFSNASLYGLAEFYPGAGASPASVIARSQGLTQSSALPPVISVVLNTDVGNWLYLYAEGIDASFNYAFETDWGAFHVSDAITQFIKYKTGLGATGIPYSILNTTGSSASFPSTATQTRADFGWARDAWAVDLFANYTGPYRNWSGTSVIPFTQNAQGNPNGGGDPVKANLTFDLHVGYQFDGGVFGNDRVSLTVVNLADTDPPFYLGATGYDNWVASPLGRIIKLGFVAEY